MIGEQKISGNLGSSGTASAFIGSLGGQREIFEGGIDDVRIYGHGLSKAAVAKLANGEGDVENEGWTHAMQQLSIGTGNMGMRPTKKTWTWKVANGKT